MLWVKEKKKFLHFVENPSGVATVIAKTQPNRNVETRVWGEGLKK